MRPDCRFCLGNDLLVDAPLFSDALFYVLASIDPQIPLAAMIVPRRHAETPFEMTADEWAGLGAMLGRVKAHFAPREPDGFTLCWNVGAVAGQEVPHAHLHVVPRFAGEPNEGVGHRRILRTPDWPDGPPLPFEDSPAAVAAARGAGREAVHLASPEDVTAHPLIAKRLR